MSEEIVVLFRKDVDGQEAEYVEIIEDSDERLVVKATFGMVDAVVEALEADQFGDGLIDPKEVEGVGTAEGRVVKHVGDILGVDPDQ